MPENKERRKMTDYQQSQAIKFLQDFILEAKKARGNAEPEMKEIQIYYLLSELDSVPDLYVADWPTSLMK